MRVNGASHLFWNVFTASAHAPEQRIGAHGVASVTVNGTTTPTATTLDVRTLRGKEDEQREVSLAARAYDHCRPPVSRRFCRNRRGGTIVSIPIVPIHLSVLANFFHHFSREFFVYSRDKTDGTERKERVKKKIVGVGGFHFFDLPSRLRATFLHALYRVDHAASREFQLRDSSSLPPGML